MMLLDLPAYSYVSPPALVRTWGVSGEACYVDASTRESVTDLSRAHSFDDGRMQVQNALSEQFETCLKRGWDGYFAEPVSWDTFSNASRFLEALPHGFPMPTVGAEADGHITLEWYRNPNRVVSFSISPEGDIHYAALLGGIIRRNGTEMFLGEVPLDLLQLVRRVMAA